MDTQFLLSQLVYAGPFLVVGCVGLVLGFVNFRRCSAPSFMAVFGCALLLLNSIVVMAAQIIFLQQLRDGELTPQQYGHINWVIGIVGSTVRGVSLAVLVVAIFVGRHQPSSSKLPAERGAPEERRGIPSRSNQQ